MLRNWKTRWRQETVPRRRLEHNRTGRRLIIQDTEPNKNILTLHKDLRRAESSVLIQARTECIGLNQFLYTRRVPGVDSPHCSCNVTPETTRHLVQYCSMYSNRETLYLSGTGQRQIDYRRLIGCPEGAKALVKWIIGTGRLGQYSIAQRLLC